MLLRAHREHVHEIRNRKKKALKKKTYRQIDKTRRCFIPTKKS